MDELTPTSRGAYVANGVSDDLLREALQGGSLTRIRHGQYAIGSRWEASYGEAREIAGAMAAEAAARDPHVFSHTTAAALHGLPLPRHIVSRPHVMLGSESDHGGSSALHRHKDAWHGDWTMRRGLRATTLERTVFDVVRTTSAETAIACADAALRRVALRGARGIDEPDAEHFRERVIALIRVATGRRGVKQARWIMAIADPRAESPGESISRLYLGRAGHDEIALQHPVPSPGGGTYFVDFAFAEVLGEYDGAQKYADAAMRGGRPVEEVVIREKRREDWIRATTGRRVIRWTTAEIASLETFREFLRNARPRSRDASKPG
ncbi:MAG: hypothetical protein ACTHZX_09775 [Microbacterium sp.]